MKCSSSMPSAAVLREVHRKIVGLKPSFQCQDLAGKIDHVRPQAEIEPLGWMWWYVIIREYPKDISISNI